MSINFNKRIPVAKDVHLNVGKKSVSISVKIPGLPISFNFGKRGAFVNVNIPGTGISTRQNIKTLKSKVGRNMQTHQMINKSKSIGLNNDA